MRTEFQRVQPAIARAAREKEGDTRLSALAREASLSPYHLNRVFSAVAKETPKQYGLRLRLGRAAALLLTRRDSVLRVALDCGFRSHEGFTRAFKRHFGRTPSAYRARGFATAATDEQREAHFDAVDRVGPCVRLFHLRS
jgi:AraC-like DNA-binding protein